MFTVDERDALRDGVIAWGRQDAEVVAGGFVGSEARGETDRWSDIDVSFGLAAGAAAAEVADRFSTWLSAHASVVDTLDMHAGGLYRVFLLGNGLQVDVSFFAHGTLRATNGEALTVVFGEAAPSDPQPTLDWHRPAAMGWLYLVHARSALGRARWWQAELMLSGLLGELLWLAANVTGWLAEARARSLEPDELRRSYAASLAAYRAVVEAWDGDLAARVEDALSPSTWPR